MANQVRNAHGLGKATAFVVPTPMRPWKTVIVRVILFIFDRIKSTQEIAKRLSFLPFVHWVVIGRNAWPRIDDQQPEEKLAHDHLFFLSTFNGMWHPYIDAYADVLHQPLDAVWRWSDGYPKARPVTALKEYIARNQLEADHHYVAYPEASVRDVRSALRLADALRRFRESSQGLEPEQFSEDFRCFLQRVQNNLGSTGPTRALP
jgi:hypothetical protein